MKLVEYQKFKKEIKAQYVFTSWTKMKLQADDQIYDIVSINVGGKNYPYIRIKSDNMENENEKNFKISTINHYENKKQLKNVLYNFDGIDYFVVGIGYKKIKAIKGSKETPDFFSYNSLEGEYLLEKLYNIITQEQSVLI